MGTKHSDGINRLLDFAIVEYEIDRGGIDETNVKHVIRRKLRDSGRVKKGDGYDFTDAQIEQLVRIDLREYFLHFASAEMQLKDELGKAARKRISEKFEHNADGVRTGEFSKLMDADYESQVKAAQGKLAIVRQEEVVLAQVSAMLQVLLAQQGKRFDLKSYEHDYRGFVQAEAETNPMEEPNEEAEIRFAHFSKRLANLDNYLSEFGASW